MLLRSVGRASSACWVMAAVPVELLSGVLSEVLAEVLAEAPGAALSWCCTVIF